MNTNEKITQAAYYKWERAGRPHGRHEEFWLHAEQEVADDETLNSEVRSLWQTARDSKKKKLWDIWQAAKEYLKS